MPRVCLLAAVAVAGAVGLPAAAEDQHAGRWQFAVTTSALDNTTGGAAFVRATNEIANQIGRPDHMELTIGCPNGGPLVIMADVKSVIGTQDGVEVRWKFDDGEIQSMRWHVGSDGVSIAYPLGRDPRPFLGPLTTARRLVVQIAGREGVFDLTGNDEVVPQMVAACRLSGQP